MFRSLCTVVALVGVFAIAVHAQPRGAKAPAAVVTLATGGEIVIELFPADAPKTVQNFVTLARRGFYNGQRFHRVEDWVVQTGDPQSRTLPMEDARVGTGGPGYTIKAEFSARPHERGAVGMARGDAPDSAGSQFYITRRPARGLDGQYTVFGRVTRGMDVVDRLRMGDRITAITITSP